MDPKETNSKEFNPKCGDKVHVMIDNKPEEVFVTAKNTMERFNVESEKFITVIEYKVQYIDRIVKASELYPSKAELLKSL